MADGFVGLWPLVGAASGDSSSVPGTATAGASVTGQDASEYVVGGFSFSPWAPVIGLVNSMGVYIGASESRSSVSALSATVNVQTGHAFAVSAAAGQNSSLSTVGGAGFYGIWPLAGVIHGSLEPLPVGASIGRSEVTGEGVYSVMGDYATPPRSVFDIPPPADFKIPGLYLEYGLPTSLRAPGAVQGEATGASSATGERRLTVVVTGEAAAEARAAGQVRAEVVVTGEVDSGARVTGVAVGVQSTVGIGSATAAAQVEGQDRSLPPGAGLGLASASSAVAGEGLSANAQSGAVLGRAIAQAVDASSYPRAFTASARGGSEVAGEAVATIIRTAQAEAHAVIAGVQATLAIAEAAAFSSATVTGALSQLSTVSPGGAWPRDPRGRNPRRPTATNTRRPVNSS